MKEIYLLDIVSVEGKKEIRTTKKYNSKKELLEWYKIMNKIFEETEYIHSKWIIFLNPKILLTTNIIDND